MRLREKGFIHRWDKAFFVAINQVERNGIKLYQYLQE